ncbi:MAG: hypothetical protein J6L83_09075 [Clostridia bacterium]|nr:hypothetical protein [Clostridia bacterium]
MELIKKCRETMSSNERVRRTFQHEKTDRVTRVFHFAPTHQIRDNTPVENVITMYNCAYKYGQY